MPETYFPESRNSRGHPTSVRARERISRGRDEQEVVITAGGHDETAAIQLLITHRRNVHVNDAALDENASRARNGRLF